MLSAFYWKFQQLFTFWNLWPEFLYKSFMFTTIWGLRNMIPLFNDFKNSHTEVALPVVLRAFKNQFWEKKKQTGIKSVENIWSRAR